MNRDDLNLLHDKLLEHEYLCPEMLVDVLKCEERKTSGELFDLVKHHSETAIGDHLSIMIDFHNHIYGHKLINVSKLYTYIKHLEKIDYRAIRDKVHDIIREDSKNKQTIANVLDVYGVKNMSQLQARNYVPFYIFLCTISPDKPQRYLMGKRDATRILTAYSFRKCNHELKNYGRAYSSTSNIQELCQQGIRSFEILDKNPRIPLFDLSDLDFGITMALARLMGFKITDTEIIRNE